jgi:hypothetical protein
MAHLKYISALLQSCLTFLEQCTHFTLTEKALDFAAILLGFNKYMNFMKGPNGSQLVKQSFITEQATYSVNFPI